MLAPLLIAEISTGYGCNGRIIIIHGREKILEGNS